MAWKKIAGAPWSVVIGVPSFVWGLPRFQDDAEAWHRLAADMSPEWAGVLVGGGAVLTVTWLAARLSNVRLSLSGEKIGISIPTRGDLAAVVFVLTALAATAIYLIYLVVASIDWPSRTTHVWTHPTLSAAEQERTKAECEMAAYDAIGGGGDGTAIGSTKGTDRRHYVSACLTAKGFKRQQINREEDK